MTDGRSADERAGVIARLRAAGCVFAEDEADVLIESATTAAELTRMVDQRVSGLPLEHVVGWAEFCGLRIAVDQGVFVPRRRTELLVEIAVPLCRPTAIVIDMCCGSGAVGVAIAAAAPHIRLHAADVEPAAVRCARRNLVAVGASVYEGDLFDPLPAALRGAVDVIVVNAPYVPTGSIDVMPREARNHEPHVTLDGGADGLDVHRRIAAEASAWLRPGGHLLIETSALQATVSADVFAAAGLQATIRTSEELDANVVVATRSTGPWSDQRP